MRYFILFISLFISQIVFSQNTVYLGDGIYGSKAPSSMYIGCPCTIDDALHNGNIGTIPLTIPIIHIPDPVSGNVSSIVPGLLTIPRINSMPDEDGPFAINPIKADTTILGLPGAIAALSYPVAITGTYSISGYLTGIHLSGCTISFIVDWTDQSGIARTYIFGSISTMDYGPVYTHNIGVASGTTIYISTSVIGCGGILLYDIGATITKVHK